MAVVARWNDAHVRHDADALRLLYAPVVLFYDAKLGNADCAKRKATAFARDPDYAQSVRDAKVMPDGNGGAFVTFAKKTNGKTYASYLFIEDGHITAEGDGSETPTVRWNWCAADVAMPHDGYLGIPRDAAVGGYKVSPLDAVRAAVREKRSKALITACPYLCAMDHPAGDCENTSGAYTLSVGGAAVEVDAMTGVVRSLP